MDTSYIALQKRKYRNVIFTTTNNKKGGNKTPY